MAKGKYQAGQVGEPGKEVTTWIDPGALTTEQDNAEVAEILGGFSNLDTISVASGLPFLGLDRAGDWKYGQEATEPEPNAYWAMDLKTARWGWIAWVDSKPADERMVSIGETRPSLHELAQGLPWTDQVSIEMVCVSGADKGLRVLYKTSSKGGVKCFMEFKNVCRRTIPNDPAKPICIVQLETYFYINKHGKIHNPLFKVAGWSSVGILKQDGTDPRPVQSNGGNAPDAAVNDAAQPAASTRRRRVAT